MTIMKTIISFGLFALCCAGCSTTPPAPANAKLLPALRPYVTEVSNDLDAVPAERIVVTTGSSGGFILAFLAMFEPGDRVAVTVPGYPPYRHILTALGCEPVLIETTSETRHALTGEALLAAHRKAPLKGVLVASPAPAVAFGGRHIAWVFTPTRQLIELLAST